MATTLSEQDIQGIIERVRQRLGDAGPDPGAGLRGHEALTQTSSEPGDGIHPTIDEAVACVKKWEFAPGTENGDAVPVLVEIEMTFKQR